MAEVIHKFGPLSPYSGKPVKIVGVPVHVGFQDEQVFVWCRRMAGEDNRSSEVRLVATGDTFIGPYIGTVIYPNGLVYHAIEVF